MKRSVRGTITIEASIIVPVILMIFSIVVTMLFYFHDKNLLSAIAHETLAMGCGKEEISENELEEYFLSRIKGKLILFPAPTVNVAMEKEKMVIDCLARKEKMKIHVEMEMNDTNPETHIWERKRLEKIKENIKENMKENIEKGGADERVF